jgi:U6 snRNA-associated Sm-like protein LSm7
MANLGLTIRIPKESLIKLGDLQGKEIVVKFNGGREVCGKLKSWDKTMNLILEGTQEILGVENGVELSRTLGLIIVKGTQVSCNLSRFRRFA